MRPPDGANRSLRRLHSLLSTYSTSSRRNCLHSVFTFNRHCSSTRSWRHCVQYLS